MAKGSAGPGVYSATYSNIPVYEFQFGPDLKEHVMRRRGDDYINATHILKACGFDKPARTRILEREVQKDTHQKVQGGYGKYQGTWIPLDAGKQLAIRNNVWEKLRPIFEFEPGDESPPPAPKHTTNKPKAPKKPSVPKFNSMSAPRAQTPDPPFDDNSMQMDDDQTPDNTTVASASYFEDSDRERFDMSQPSTGHRRRSNYLPPTMSLSVQEQRNIAFADELLDYFLAGNPDSPVRPDPPVDYIPEYPLDREGNTALHWACAMGDIDMMNTVLGFKTIADPKNVRGETPLMRVVNFTNCQERQVFPLILEKLYETLTVTDNSNNTALHHIAQSAASKHRHHIARYYFDVVLNRMSGDKSPEEIRQILDMQDSDGNTACHIVAGYKARKCVRALLGRGASTDIQNNEGVVVEDLISELNATLRASRHAASSSPFAPDSHHRNLFKESNIDAISRHTTAHHSEAAMTLESKVMPLALEKFQSLAQSFDDELVDRDRSEKEAKRILKQTQLETAQIRERIAQYDADEEDEEERLGEEAELARLKTIVASIIEQQQQILLSDAVQQEKAMSNGVNGHGMHDDLIETSVDLCLELEREQIRRRGLIEKYVEALSNAGMGDKGERYRSLTAKILGMTPDEVDAQIDDLISVLKEDNTEDRNDPMMLD